MEDERTCIVCDFFIPKKYRQIVLIDAIGECKIGYGYVWKRMRCDKFAKAKGDQ